MNIVAACIGVAIALLFLGALAALINSTPLTVIMAIGGLLIIADFIGSLRQTDREV